MNKKINKKGSVGTTLTWFVALFIIVFVMVLFIFLSTVLAGKKFLPFVGEGRSEIDLFVNSDYLATQRDTLVLLKEDVEFDGKNMSIKDATLLIMGPYLKSDVFSKLEVSDINDLYLKRESLSPETLISGGVVYIDGKAVKEEEYFELINNSLKDDCFEYIFRFPLGYVYNLGKRESYGYGSPPGLSEYDILLGQPFIISIPYQEHMINIKLQSRKIC